MKLVQPRQNYLGLGGWVWAGKYKLERYLYFLHRIAGLIILFYGIIYLIMVNISRIQGQDIWVATIAIVHQPWFRIVIFALVYHVLNGLRLVLQELGFTLGQPAPPIYPYQDSLRQKRSWTIAMVAVVVMLNLVILFIFLAGGS